MQATGQSGITFRLFSLLLVMLLLAIMVLLLLIVASDQQQEFSMLRDFAAVLTGGDDAAPPQRLAAMLLLLGAVALPVAVILVRITTRQAQQRQQRHAIVDEQRHQQLQKLQHAVFAAVAGERVSWREDAVSRLVNRQAASAGERRQALAEAAERLAATAESCRGMSQKLLDGSRFEAAHVHAAGGVVSSAARSTAEIGEQAEAAAALALELQQQDTGSAAHSAAADEVRVDEVLTYFADLLRRMAKVARQQSESVAAVVGSCEAIGEISQRSSATAAQLSQCAAELAELSQQLRCHS
jgi:hypothetical protein